MKGNLLVAKGNILVEMVEMVLVELVLLEMVVVEIVLVTKENDILSFDVFTRKVAVI